MEKFIKITPSNFDEFIDDNYDSWLCDRVKTFLIGNCVDNQCLMQESLINCESPIEQLLSIELENLRLDNICIYNPYIDVVAIERQKNISINKKNYRVDFYITVIYKNQEEKVFVIECDGYEFHQKTKQQVENDNKRQRDLQQAGFEVIRFSGTEIYNKPYKCAIEIKDIILSKCKYIKDE